MWFRIAMLFAMSLSQQGIVTNLFQGCAQVRLCVLDAAQASERQAADGKHVGRFYARLRGPPREAPSYAPVAAAQCLGGSNGIGVRVCRHRGVSRITPEHSAAKSARLLVVQEPCSDGVAFCAAVHVAIDEVSDAYPLWSEC